MLSHPLHTPINAQNFNNVYTDMHTHVHTHTHTHTEAHTMHTRTCTHEITRTHAHTLMHTEHRDLKSKRIEQIDRPAKLPDYFLWSNKSNICQSHTHIHTDSYTRMHIHLGASNGR